MAEAANEMINADDYLVDNLRSWSDDVGESIASKLFDAVDYGLDNVQKEFDVQLARQKVIVKENADQISDLKNHFKRFFGWKESIFWIGLCLLVGLSALNTYLLLR